MRTAHEQGAAHAADGYARSTGRTGVVIATSGPGATNLVTGIATAYMDSVPMVAITGNVNLNLLGLDSFQEVDITGITMPITKHNYIVKGRARFSPRRCARRSRLPAAAAGAPCWWTFRRTSPARRANLSARPRCRPLAARFPGGGAL